MGSALEKIQSRNSLVLVGDFNTHRGSDGETWRGRTGKNSLPDP